MLLVGNAIYFGACSLSCILCVNGPFPSYSTLDGGLVSGSVVNSFDNVLWFVTIVLLHFLFLWYLAISVPV